MRRIHCLTPLLLTFHLIVSQGDRPLAQSPPELPLLQSGAVKYLGTFAVPATDGTDNPGGRLIYGGHGLGVTPDGRSLYFGCVPSQSQPDWLAKITIPPLGETASIIERCREIPNLGAIDPDPVDGFVLGGTLEYNDRLLISAYSYYDQLSSVQANLTHFWATPALTNIRGPAKVGKAQANATAGYMGLVPPEWRELFGGPAFTGLCCTNIISRSSYGPALHIFNPDEVGTEERVPATTVLEYPQDRYLMNDWNVTSEAFNGTSQVAGVAWPLGTRSVLFFGRQGTGPFCYGVCPDPASSYAGSHAYPYRNQIWAYDANDLLAVKQGRKDPWEPRPYGIWPITDISNDGRATVVSATYDAPRRRLYVTTEFSENPKVHVFEIAEPSAENTVQRKGRG